MVGTVWQTRGNILDHGVLSTKRYGKPRAFYFIILNRLEIEYIIEQNYLLT